MTTDGANSVNSLTICTVMSQSSKPKLCVTSSVTWKLDENELDLMTKLETETERLRWRNSLRCWWCSFARALRFRLARPPCLSGAPRSHVLISFSISATVALAVRAFLHPIDHVSRNRWRRVIDELHSHRRRQYACVLYTLHNTWSTHKHSFYNAVWMQNLPSLHCHWVQRLYTSAPTHTKMTILGRVYQGLGLRPPGAQMAMIFKVVLTFVYSKQMKKSTQRRRKHCALAVVRQSRNFSPRWKPPSRGCGTAKI